MVAAFQLQCDAERRAILKCISTVDIRACPGSGKTSLLVAKLAILQQRWPLRHQGICVLSHTNVAHQEIRRRFPVVPGLRSLESFPHYLGTIQSFVDTVLGVPAAVNLLGRRPCVIDDGASEAAAARLLQLGMFAGVNAWVNANPNQNYGLATNLHLALGQDGKLSVTSPAGDLPSVTSKTFPNLVKLKKLLIKDGIYCYADMDFLANLLLDQHPSLADTIAHRFPLVLMDETQDTKASQARLLDRLFLAKSVIQRVGDDRQAIYDIADEADAGVTFPSGNTLPLSSSKRMSTSIAGLVQNVCIHDPEPLTGNATHPDLQHTVFLFSSQTISNVLPAFAEHVAQQIGIGLPPSQVMAVGFRRTGSGAPEQLPFSISDYWANFSVDAVRSRKVLPTLADYLAVAAQELSLNGDLVQPRERLLQACVQILNLQGLKDGEAAYTTHRLLRRLMVVDHQHAPGVLVLCAEVFKQMMTGAPISAASIGTELLAKLKPLYAGAWDEAVTSFIADAPGNGDAAPAPQARSDNVFRHTVNGATVEVGLDTIHSVKGLTLTATLVLSTRYYTDHDLPYLAKHGLLIGQRPSKTSLKLKRLPGHARRIFVAMSRPTHLLCLAIRDDHLDTERKTALAQQGWQLKVV